MESRDFSRVLREAVDGDNESMAAIITMFMPLINNRSMIGGEPDEDARQYILLRVIKAIPRFYSVRRE